MIVHNISPVLLQLGPLAIRWYGLIYMLGFVLGYLWLRHAASKKWVKGLTKDNAESYIVYLLLGVVLGARLFEVFVYHPAYYLANPVLIPQVWLGGLSFHGGLVGAAFVTWLFIRKHKIQFYDLADLLVIPAALALGLGRIANFINGEIPGILSNLSWCVTSYPDHPTIEGCRHPVVLYESLKNLFMAIVLYLLYMRREKLPKGFIFWSFVSMYGFLRFFITFLRDEPHVLLGLNMGQVLSFIMLVLGVTMLFFLWKNASHVRKRKV
ncbi:MAG: prolipoprotein diacylglyceryl transferase [Candidatus Woesearchaeota archaeon]